jgi:hypothetical protein
VFDIDVDFVDHAVSVRTVAGAIERIPLRPMTVASFYSDPMDAMRTAGVPTEISTSPSEVPFTTPFDEDVEHATYDPDWANRYWRVLATVDAVMKEHRGRFRGKVRPSTSSGVRLTWRAPGTRAA